MGVGVEGGKRGELEGTGFPQVFSQVLLSFRIVQFETKV